MGIQCVYRIIILLFIIFTPTFANAYGHNHPEKSDTSSQPQLRQNREVPSSTPAPVEYKSKEWWEYFVIPLLVPLGAAVIIMIIVCVKQEWLKKKLSDIQGRPVQYNERTQSPEFQMGTIGERQGRENNIDEPPPYDAAITVIPPDKLNTETSFNSEIYTIESPPSYFMLQNIKADMEPVR